MGEKGSRLTQDSVLVAKLLLEKLEGIGGIAIKKMFGGHGVFHKGKMFAIVDSKGQAFLKATDNNREDLERWGSKKHGKMPYFSIPNAILNDSKSLLNLANKTLEALN